MGNWGACVPQLLSNDQSIDFLTCHWKEPFPKPWINTYCAITLLRMHSQTRQGQWCCTTRVVLAQTTDSQVSSHYSFRKDTYSQQRATPLCHLIWTPASQWYRPCFAEPSLSNSLHWILSTLLFSECTRFPPGNPKIRQEIISCFQCWQP